MDVFSNVVEGTRQFFMGVPKPAMESNSWAAPAPSEDPAPAQSGAPTPTAPPPSAAAAPPPPRPPSEPIEPEPHIIHKATVMREAAEKRRERPQPEDEDEASSALSPPPHVIRRPLPDPAPVPASPAPRPPSKAPTPVAPSSDAPTSRGPTPHSATPVARPPEHFAPARPLPDPYSSSRPPEPYPARYYEPMADASRPLGPLPSPQPPPRHGSPQTYARMSSSLPTHAARLREVAAHSPPAQRYLPATSQPPPHNDRVPPIHHPVGPAPPAPAPHRVAVLPVPDARAAQYPPMPQRREPSPYNRTPHSSHYERHLPVSQRKYDYQQSYPGYRPTASATQPTPTHRVETHQSVQYKHAPVEAMSAQYPVRPIERVPAPTNPYPHEPVRRAEYPSMTRTTADARSGYHYPTPSTSSARYAPATQVAAAPVVQSSTAPPRSIPRPAAAAKSHYEYPTSNHVQTSPARSTVKPGYPNQQARMTVSVTSIVNQMNQTKQKRESPLDLSVKTVKNSADSSTTQDDVVDSASGDKTLPLQLRPSNQPSVTAPVFTESHKVDFAPNFSQYRERSTSHSSHTYPATAAAPSHHPLRYNGAYEVRRPAPEGYTIESRHHVYPDRKYALAVARTEYVPRIDLTDDRRPDAMRENNRIRDDRNFIIEDRKRPSGPIVSNIPEKIVKYETWTSDSRIDRMTQSAREQHELMSQPVYSYSSHKQFEAYQNEQRRLASASGYREHHHHHASPRYPHPADMPPRERLDHHHPHDRRPSIGSRQVIQKIPSHRDVHPHHLNPHGGIPADKTVLSILRNSLETKQTGLIEPAKPTRHIPDLIVIDDVDDSVIEITDLTKDNEVEVPRKTAPRPLHNHGPSLDHHIQMPKAVDSIATEYQNTDSKSPPENDVASRIRTKAELKGLPSDTTIRMDLKHEQPVRIVPKSQKQHLFNQIREDQRLESVIKSEKGSENLMCEVKSEPMNIDEIEKDAVEPIKTDTALSTENNEPLSIPEPEDLDWANACDSFMEQLKSGAHKKKTQRKRVDTLDRDNEANSKIPKVEPIDCLSEPVDKTSQAMESTTDLVVIKQEPIDEDEIKDDVASPLLSGLDQVKKNIPENKVTPSDEIKETLPEKNESSCKVEKKKKSIILEKETGKGKSKTCDENKPNKNDKQKNKSPPEKEKKTLLSEKEKNSVSPEKGKPTSSPEQESKSSKKDQVKRKSSNTEMLEKGKAKKSLLDDKSNLLEKTKKTLTVLEGKEKVKGKKSISQTEEKESTRGRPKKILNEDSSKIDKEKSNTNKTLQENTENDKKLTLKGEKNKFLRKNAKICDKSKDKQQINSKAKTDKNKTLASEVTIKKEIEDDVPLSVAIKEEPESTDDDEPLIKSKLQKEKDIKYQLLKDLSEKSPYVKLECFDVDLNKNTRISIDSLTKDNNEKQVKGKNTRQASKSKDKIVEKNKTETQNEESSNSEDEDLTVAKRLRVRKTTKTEETKVTPAVHKTPAKTTPKKQDTPSISNCSTPFRKSGFGDGSDFHPGWEEELYRYKRSLRMPTRLIAIPRGRSGGPFVKRLGASFNRGSTSLPDLDPAPLSPAPSSAPSAATDDLYARRPDKLAVDSDLESNSSYSATNRLQYDSEASTSTVFSSTVRKKTSSIVDVLIQKCGKLENTKKKSKDKDKDEKTPKVIPKSSNANELLPTPSLGLVKNGNKGNLSAKKEKLMEDIFYLGAFRKETVNAYRTAFIKNTDGLIGATEEFAPVVLKSRTRTESRVLKQRATIKEVFGDERPASAPPTSCIEEEKIQEPEEPEVQIKKESDTNTISKPKLKPKKIIKDKLQRRSSSIRDGLRSTKSLKRNDAKGRLMRLKKRNSLMMSLASKRMKDLAGNKIKKENKPAEQEDNDKSKEDDNTSEIAEGTKRRFKRLFVRRKFSSGFDYIKKKKKVIRREDTPNNKTRRPAAKPSPESVHDIHKEIKTWFINKSVGETPLHRAARLGYTDCVAYCLETMKADPSARDNAGFTPLHVASAKGHVRIARLLLQYGANVSAAANGGIRPLHEACENFHLEVIRLLLAYGADPLLGTYAGQTPEELTEGSAAATRLIRLHIADVQGHAIEPWRFPPPAEIIDREELGCDPLCSPPPGSPAPPEATVEMQCTYFPLPPFYSLKTQPSEGYWCLLQDIINLLQIKSKESLLKQIHCGSGSPKELFKEIRTQEFLERFQCHQLLCAGEKVNIRASKVALVRVTDKLRQLLKIETVLIS